MTRLLCIVLFGVAVSLCGCQSLGAWMGSLSVSEDGAVKGELESAGQGGDFHKNTGLNLTAGDNSLVAITLAAVAVIAVPFVYPIQRMLRLRREQAAVKRNKQLKDAVMGTVCLLFVPLVSGCVTAPANTNHTAQKQRSKLVCTDSAHEETHEAGVFWK